MHDLYKNIKEKRLALKMSQDTLAMLTGYKDRSSIAKIEKGEVDISESKLREFAKALKTTPQELMGWSDHEGPYYLDDDTREMVEFLHNNPDYKVLFDASRNVKKEDIDFVKQMMDRLRGDNHGDDTGC